MAVMNLSVTIADADLPRLLAAARSVFGDQLGEPQVIEALRQHGIQQMRQLVHDYERRIAISQAEALVPQIEVS
jgi:hypothetical protein